MGSQQLCALVLAAADDDETGLPDDIAAWEEDGEEQQQQEEGDSDDADAAGQQQQRQQARRRHGVPAGISEAVAAAMEGDGGYAMTGFNMRQEREEGNIDEEVGSLSQAELSGWGWGCGGSQAGRELRAARKTRLGFRVLLLRVWGPR